MKSWVDCLSPWASSLSVPCRGHTEINQCLVKVFGMNRIIGRFLSTLSASVWGTKNLTNVWPRYFRMKRIIGHLHWCLGIIWCKQKIISMNKLKNCLCTVNFISLTHVDSSDIMRTFLITQKKWNFEWNWNITSKFVTMNDPVIWFFSNTHWCSYLYTMEQVALWTWGSCSNVSAHTL